MDAIQKELIKAGRKDLAQEYYKKTSGLSDRKRCKTYEVYRDGWNVGKLFTESDAKKMVKFFESMIHAEAENFKPKMKIKEEGSYLDEKEIEKLKKLRIEPEFED